jgi:heme-degrading monooxygenase HmoA
MATMLIRHRVADYTAWMSAFAEERPVRRAHGSQQERVFRNATDPHEVLVLLEWDVLERARLYADSDDARVAMRQAGVTDQPDIWLLQESDDQLFQESGL